MICKSIVWWPPLWICIPHPVWVISLSTRCIIMETSSRERPVAFIRHSKSFLIWVQKYLGGKSILLSRQCKSCIDGCWLTLSQLLQLYYLSITRCPQQTRMNDTPDNSIWSRREKSDYIRFILRSVSIWISTRTAYVWKRIVNRNL